MLPKNRIIDSITSTSGSLYTNQSKNTALLVSLIKELGLLFKKNR